jgi:hypothetical protein
MYDREMNNLLFNLPPEKYTGKQCRDCIFMTGNQWNSSLKYCQKQKGRTKFQPLKRIKARDKACPLFQEKTK